MINQDYGDPNPPWLWEWPEWIAGWDIEALGPRQYYTSTKEVPSVRGEYPPFVAVDRLGCNPGNGIRWGVLKNLPDQVSSPQFSGAKNFPCLTQPFTLLLSEIMFNSNTETSIFLDTMGSDGLSDGFRLWWEPTDDYPSARWGTLKAALSMNDGSFLEAEITDPVPSPGTPNGRDRTVRASDAWLFIARLERGEEWKLSIDAAQPRSGGPLNQTSGGWIARSSDMPSQVVDGTAPLTLYPTPGEFPLTIGRADQAPEKAWYGMWRDLYVFEPLAPEREASAVEQVIAWW